MYNLLSQILTIFTIPQFIVLVAFVLSFFAILIYYIALFARVAWSKEHKNIIDTDNDNNISIIIVVKDNLEFLQEDIEILMLQEYAGDFQVVIVNNQSQLYETEILLLELQNRFKNLYVTKIAPTDNHLLVPKLAYTIGVKAAKYGNILFLSAHASIKSEKWLSNIAPSFCKGNIVTSYCRVQKDNMLYNKVFRARNIIQSLLYMGRIVCQKPYMATEEIFGFKKNLFFENKGFSKYLRLDRGENDLFIQSLPKRNRKVVLNLNIDTTVETIKDTTYNSYLSTESYKIFTRHFYNFDAKFYLFMYNFFNMLFGLSILVLVYIFVPNNLIISIALAALLVLKISLLLAIVHKLSSRTKEKVPYLFMIIYDFISPYEELVLSIKNKINYRKDTRI